MSGLSVLRALNVTGRLVMLAVCWLALGAPATASGMPKPDVAIALRDGRFLHLAPMPLGALAAAVVGSPIFDASGTRALLLAEFPGAGVHGDWRAANPIQAFLIDAQRRTATQLTTDGLATNVRWAGASNVVVTDGPRHTFALAVGDAQHAPLPAGRFLAGDAVPAGSAFVSPKSTDRLAVYKTGDGRYAVVQIGARRFRVAGISRNGAYALIGGYLAWIDGQRHIPQQIARLGPENAEPLSFAGSPYGDALAPILPLGNPVYQMSYRSGVAYFAFAYGVERIVAATNDLVNFWFPQLPHAPVFTVGDGLGVSPDGALYFVRPEEDVMLFTRRGRYVRAQVTGLDAARDQQPLIAAMRALEAGAFAEPLQPSEDALDTALMEWRFYPVGDASGERWVGSRLGRLLVGDRAGHFGQGNAPAFPFALLGRTDDGRLWGVSPLSRSALGDDATKSTLWWSRDGAAWHVAATLDGDAGAVGSQQGAIWVALTRRWFGRPMIWLARLDGSSPGLFPTGGIYAGEQLGFADLANGFYLVWGATPGRRLGGESGPLSAFRVDAARLAELDGAGNNAYISQRMQPDTDPSLPGPGDRIAGASTLLEPSLALVRSLPHARLTVRTNIAPGVSLPARVTLVGSDQERAFELKYAERPYPLATAWAKIEGDRATVSRSIEYGPLRASGSVEHWTKDAAGGWRLTNTTSRYSY